MPKYVAKELCDCGFAEVVDRGDGLHLCEQCRVELGLSDGKYCLAYAEQAIQVYGPNFTAAQASTLREPFRQPRYKHTGNRRNGGAQ